MSHEIEEEKARRARRRQLMEKRKRHNRRLRFVYACVRTFGPYVAGAAGIVVLLFTVGRILHQPSGNVQARQAPPAQTQQMDNAEGLNDFRGPDAMQKSDDAQQPDVMREPDETQEPGNAQGLYKAQEPGGTQAVGAAGEPAGAQAAANTAFRAYTARSTANTRQLGAEVDSAYAILIDRETGNILAQKDAKTTINPASMTKILTVLVAAEHVKNLDDTFTVTLEHTDYSYVNDCSSVGFAENEVVTVRDLLYGTILPSGGDAAAALADYVAGSREAFVDLMNDKLEQLGLSDTSHMTNCVGLFDKEHYCTAYDMAMILEAAIDNELCRKVLSAHTYTTSSTVQHPDGITISNWFLRRIEDKDTGGEVICAKTGYVVQSGNCAASYGVDGSGKEYICVTGDAGSNWKCIYDHVALYKEFSSEG